MQARALVCVCVDSSSLDSQTTRFFVFINSYNNSIPKLEASHTEKRLRTRSERRNEKRRGKKMVFYWKSFVCRYLFDCILSFHLWAHYTQHITYVLANDNRDTAIICLKVKREKYKSSRFETICNGPEIKEKRNNFIDTDADEYNER